LEFAVLWTIKLEFTPGGGEPQVRQIGTISRSMNDLRPEEAGLTLQEGRELLRGIECQIIANQVHFYTLCFGSCPDCGQRRQFKDVRTKCVQTVFGAYRFRGRGIRTCACEGMRASRTTIWRHTVALGKAIEEDQLDASRTGTSSSIVAPRTVSVGIDDTDIRHCQRDASRQIQVTGGRIERNGKLAERFAFVAAAPDWSRDQFAGILHQLGIGGCKSVRVVSDGDDGLRNFVRASLGKQVQSLLDWFHIGMRLERLRNAVRLPMTYAEFLRNPEQLKPLERRVSGIRDVLWRGRPWRALLQLARLRRDIERWAAKHPGVGADSLARVTRAIDEFQGSVGGNRRSVPSFAKARAAGRRTSTAHVESVMNHLINHRMSKKQQMRWSPAGAHYLLQVRVELLNDTLLDPFRVWHERFRTGSRCTPCLA
jgi:hypothetical protein